MKIVVYGQPIGQARPRFKRIGQYVKTYNVQHPEVQCVRAVMLECLKDFHKFNDVRWPLDGVYEMHMTFVFEPTKSTTKSQTNLKLWNVLPHIQKPDCSNMFKFYEDCANGLLYVDDAQITIGSFRKLWGPESKVIIEIKEALMLEIDKAELEVMKIINPKEMKELSDDITILQKHLENSVGDGKDVYQRGMDQMTAIELEKFARKWSKTLVKVSKIDN